jgi:hypothetical protein
MTVISSRGGTTGSGGSGEDHHSSWSIIGASQTVTISQNKQSVVFGEFVVDGTLILEGDLILED